MGFIHWFHHLFNPHCPSCEDRIAEARLCRSCETLRDQLAIANFEKKQLLNSILEKPIQESTPIVDYEKLPSKASTWNVRRQMLEAEDRRAAQVLAEKKKRDAEAAVEAERTRRIRELENEMGIPEAANKEAEVV